MGANGFVAANRRGRGLRIAAMGGLCLIAAFLAQAAEVNPEDLDSLYKALLAGQSSEPLRKWQSDDGFLRFVGAPPDTFFAVSQGAKAATAESLAHAFVSAHIGAFATRSSRQTFETDRVNARFTDRTYVRLQQVYQGIPVFAGQMVVQTHGTSGVACVMSDVLHDLTPLDTGALSLTPSVGDTAAQDAATQWMIKEYGGAISEYAIETPQRVIFDPAIVDQEGAVTIAWKLTVASSENPMAIEVILVDGYTGKVVFHYPLAYEAKVRAISDADSTASLGRLVRSEGDPPCGIRDADLAYDFLGDTYDFYYRVHNRDSIDNKGMELAATVRYCYFYCPYPNAFWAGEPWNRMVFGEGYAVDDVTAHELTHGVTDSESNLIYQGQSGAMNESFSDIWGEFVDLTNGKGTDTAAARWLMGEDLPIGAIRSMKDPTLFGDPDRLNSPLYYTGFGDNGGVHYNSGILNKLCYLLTDGDTFNGQTVAGMGIEPVARLFYETQIAPLPMAASFSDFYMFLGQATINQGLDFNQRLNVRAAAEAVEIAPATSEEKIRGFRALPALDRYGRPVIALTWANPSSENFRRVILVRSTAGFPQNPSDGMQLYQGTEEKFLDIAVVRGTKYFYSLFSDTAYGFPDRATGCATAGAEPPDFLSQAFETQPARPSVTPSPFDLSYSQITFWPVGAATGGLGEPSLPDYANYAATIRRNIYELPVARQDADGVAQTVPYNADMVYGYTFSSPFQFFGKKYSTLYIAANGYIAFAPIQQGTVENSVPSLASHFAVPRISFLFTHFMPTAGGLIWLRELDDRLVVTFENMISVDAVGAPGNNLPNTVQAEVYHSGHVRLTYLYVGARTAVVGLSDGMGVPVDPSTLFPNVRSVNVRSDLSELPQSLTALAIEPIATQSVDPGEWLNFDVRTTVPVGTPGTPALQAEWDGAGAVPFADNHDGTGAFRWQTTYEDRNTIFTVRITATLGTMSAYQDVTLMVGVDVPLPDAIDLRLHSGDPVEDPSRSRVVSMEYPLTAEYTYTHPMALSDPLNFGEGRSIVMWYKNNVYAGGLTNQMTVPPTAFKAEDRWFFVVTPKTAYGLSGMPRMSPVVTLMPLPLVQTVALRADVPAVVSPSSLPLSGLPRAVGSSAGGTEIVLLGKNLGQPLSVTVGGIEARSLRGINDNRIELTTPEHVPSPEVGGVRIAEDIRVTTRFGSGTVREAFTYVPADVAIVKADVNLDGFVNAVDIQLVINAVLQKYSPVVDADVNRDGRVNSADIQITINEALLR